MMKTRTFKDREQDLFSAASPFKTVEEYTEWFLTQRAMDLTKEAEEINDIFRQYHIKEVSIEVAVKISVNTIEVLEDDLDSRDLWDSRPDYDSFLTINKPVAVGANVFNQKVSI